MLVSLCWVPRGAPLTKLPQGTDDRNDIDHEGDEMDTVQDNQSSPENEADELDNDEEKSDSEVDVSEVLANEFDSLAFHKHGEKDPNLTSDPKGNVLFDEEELDDLNMRPTDSLIVTANSGDDISSLQVHVFDDDPDASDDEGTAYVPHTYIHHDLILPALPLCTAYTRITLESEAANLVAVGMFTPGIDIWDVDRVNNLEPVASLGGYNVSETMKTALAAARAARQGGKARRKRKPKPQLKEGSHRDAVMSLSWNAVQREYLASGSADTTVKVWDIESSHCACTLNHHTDKVQAVAFHPAEAQLLLTGAFDRSIHVVDVRTAKNSKQKWSVNADVETVQWGTGANDGMVAVSTEDGGVSLFDSRKSGKSAILASWKAHDGATSACSLSHDVAGLMVTGGIDKVVKVWDVRLITDGGSADLIFEKKSREGSLFALSLCDLPHGKSNVSPFVVALGGSRGRLSVRDLAVESSAVRGRFLSQCETPALNAIERRAARSSKHAKSENLIENGDDVDSDDQDQESDSSESEERSLS